MCSKLEAAGFLAAALVPVGGQRPLVATLPPLVAGHYLRSLLDWAVGVLTKADDSGGRKQRGAAATEAGWAQASPRLSPACWGVLTAVLRSPSIPATHPLPASLLPAMTATLQALAGPDQAHAARVLPVLWELLELAAAKFGHSYRPGLVHAAAAAEAAFAASLAAGSAESQLHWQLVALHASRLLRVTAEPVPRKAFEAVVPRLLLPLGRAAFPSAEGGSSSVGTLAAECQALLAAVLFNPVHIAALAEAAAPTSLGGQGQQSYAARLLPALAELLEQQQLPLALLSWLAGRYCTALQQYRRAAQTQAAISAAAGDAHFRDRQRAEEGEQQQQQHRGEEGAQPFAGDPVPVSAAFDFWAALLRLAIGRLQQLTPWASQQAQQEAAEVLRGLADLAACLGEHRIYHPTQDPAGQQRALLQQLTDAAVATAVQQEQEHQQHQHQQQAAQVVEAALQVVGGVLAVEHRPVQQHLPQLWPLLWAGGAGSSGSGASAASASGSAVGVRASLACSLVATYGELRQLEVLLQALTAALLAAQAGVAGAATAVLDSQPVLCQLAATSGQLPSGQVPAIIRFAAGVASQVAAASAGKGGPGTALLLADLLCCCLGSLRIELSMAPAAASAAEGLVAALAPGVLPLLVQPLACLDAQQTDRLTALLQLYGMALQLHASCAALHPEASVPMVVGVGVCFS